MEKQVLLSFPDLLRFFLNKSDITQKKLAKMLNVRESSISYYIHGEQRPKANTVLKLASIFTKSGVMTDHQKVTFLQSAFVENLPCGLLDMLIEIEKYQPYFSIHPPRLSRKILQKIQVSMPCENIDMLHDAWLEEWKMTGCKKLKNPDADFRKFCKENRQKATVSI